MPFLFTGTKNCFIYDVYFLLESKYFYKQFTNKYTME